MSRRGKWNVGSKVMVKPFEYKGIRGKMVKSGTKVRGTVISVDRFKGSPSRYVVELDRTVCRGPIRGIGNRCLHKVVVLSSGKVVG